MDILDFIAQDPNKTVFSTYRIVDGNISVSAMTKNADIPAYQVDFVIESILEQMGTDHYYAVIDIRNVFWASPDIKKWIKGEFAARVVKGYAIIADSRMSALLADAWVKVVDLPFPVKRFRTYEEGLDWVRSLKAKADQQAA